MTSYSNKSAKQAAPRPIQLPAMPIPTPAAQNILDLFL